MDAQRGEPGTTLEVLEDTPALVSAAATTMARLMERAIRERGRCTLALSGGSTPRPVYGRLAAGELADRIRWRDVHVFWGDERCVPPDDAASNYRMAREALLDHVPLPAENVHRMHGELDPPQAAADYEAQLRRFFAGRPPLPPTARFDVVLLGLGDDGHTASLFPGQAAVRETERWVLAEYVEKLAAWRLTLTPVVLDAARHVVFLVSGTGKAEALRRVFQEPRDVDAVPAQAVRPSRGEVTWLVDRAAAGRLEPR
ncbi:MAG TPA: 6-phosphogluconolactonase [Gemmatimonadaceae bacterium]|nr:6-phosphogluconolactonase [Gemmatimonadaceae bacterium]